MGSLPVFFVAPHRVVFLSGAVQALAAMAFWSLELGGRAGVWPAPAWPMLTILPASVLHAFGLWAWRYAPCCWRPRADGRPG